MIRRYSGKSFMTLITISKYPNPKIHVGLELLSALSATELKPIEIRDLLYNLVTKDYSIIDEILEAAPEREASATDRKDLCADSGSINSSI